MFADFLDMWISLSYGVSLMSPTASSASSQVVGALRCSYAMMKSGADSETFLMVDSFNSIKLI